MLEDYKIDKDTMIKLLQGAYVAIDGLWFLGVEKAYGFEEALRIDLDVWGSWMQILSKRIQRETGIKGNDLLSIAKIIKIASDIEGSDLEVIEITEDRAVLRTKTCRWYENLKKAGRENLAPCEKVEEATFLLFIKALNPKMRVTQTSWIPKGDKYCDFVIELD
jgi:hypothetical protein